MKIGTVTEFTSAGFAFNFFQDWTQNQNVTDGNGIYIEYKSDGDVILDLCGDDCSNPEKHYSVTLTPTSGNVVKKNFPWSSFYQIPSNVNVSQLEIKIQSVEEDANKDVNFTLKKLGWYRPFPTTATVSKTYSPTLKKSDALPAGYAVKEADDNLNAGDGQAISAIYIDKTGACGEDGCESVQGTVTVNVAKKAPVIEDLQYEIPAPAATAYNGVAQPISVTAKPSTGTGFGTITVKYNGSTTVPTNAGTYSVTVSIAEGSNYLATTTDFQLGNYVINKKALVLTDLAYAIPGDHVYNGSPRGFSVTPNTSGIGALTVLYNGNTAAPTNAGTYPVTVQVAEVSNYQGATLELGSYTIAKKDPAAGDLNFTTPNRTYNGLPQSIGNVTLKPAYTGMGAITVKYNGSTTVPTNADTYPITVDIAAGTNFNSASDLSLGNYVIAKAPLILTAKNYTVKKDVGSDPSPYGYTVSGLVNGETQSAVITGEPTIALASPFSNGTAGATAINISGGTISSNYAPQYVNGVLTVTDKEILTIAHIVFPAAAKTYIGLAQVPTEPTLAGSITAGVSPTWTLTYTAVTGTLDGTSPKGAGTYNVAVKYDDSDNFYESEEPVTFTINKAPLAITGFSISKPYDGNADVEDFGALEFSGLVNGETATVNAAGVSATYNNANAGTGKAIAFAGDFGMTGGTANAANYAITQPTGITGTITKAAGATVAAPTSATKTPSSITIGAVSAPDGQTVEYAKNTTNSAPASGWQDGLTFSGLNANTTYYIFARAKENANYNAGAASASYSVTTSASGGNTPVLSQVDFGNKAVQIANGLSLTVGKSAVVSIYGLKGNLVKTMSYASGEHQVTLGSLPKGMYIVKVSFGGSQSKVIRMTVK